MNTDTDTPTIALLAIHAAASYSAEQVDDTMTARDLMNALQDLIDEHGDDVVIVTRDGGNLRGACFGSVSTSEDTFTILVAECDECGAYLSDKCDEECPNA